MHIGVSTASLYPMTTEKALLFLAEQGIGNVEIFINCDTEVQGAVRREISRIVRSFSLNVQALHPVTALDSFFLFSNYGRRLEQYMDIHRRYFECMNEWGTDIFVFHGLKNESPKSIDFYLERYMLLAELAAQYGISVAQENIVYCKSGNLEFLKKMTAELGNKAAFTLDLKQAVRSGYSAFEILDALGDKIIHIHASDSGAAGDCLPIGKGTFDFKELFRRLGEIRYERGMVLELYSDGYDDPSELRLCVDRLTEFR